jgi:hypothetical protein
MKKLFTSLVLSAIFVTVCQAQMAGKFFQGTLKPGSAPNTMMVVIKSSASFSGKFSKVQFTFQIPNTISPRPVIRITKNPLATYIPTVYYGFQVDEFFPTETDEGGFYNYLFTAAPYPPPYGSEPNYNFTAGMEIDALEVGVTGTGGLNVTARLASLPNGGSTRRQNFYVEVGGNDNTNFTSMFYGTGASNGGSYANYSFVPLANVILPLKIVSFNAIEIGNNAMLNWSVENESFQNSYFKVERSTNGTLFTAISTLNVMNNGSSTNTYKYTDPNISSIKSNGLIYYRLKQVDKDGLFAYSEIRKVEVKTPSLTLGILSNPINAGNLNLTIQAATNGKGILKIFNSKGQMVYQSAIIWNEGYNERSFSLHGLAVGNYIANLVVGNKQHQIRFVK